MGAGGDILYSTLLYFVLPIRSWQFQTRRFFAEGFTRLNRRNCDLLLDQENILFQAS